MQGGLQMSDIFEEVAMLRREHKTAALATVVGGEKGSPGKTGFRMLVYPDGKISGTVGGGLLEAKVREEALRCISDKKTRLLEEGEGDFSLNLPVHITKFVGPVGFEPTIRGTNDTSNQFHRLFAWGRAGFQELGAGVLISVSLFWF